MGRICQWYSEDQASNPEEVHDLCSGKGLEQRYDGSDSRMARYDHESGRHGTGDVNFKGAMSTCQP